jgi:serine/threonine-protein phosphatase 2B catalytic subunit
MHRWGGSTAFPSVITVFSAPNYCGSYKNKGAVILIENDKMNIKQYKDVDQPFILPNNLDLFSWSLPFLADKIGEMMDNIMKRASIVNKDKIKLVKQTSDVDFEKIMDELQEEQKQESQRKVASIKAKVMTIARFNRMLKNAKENQELLTKAKKLSHDGKLPSGTLLKTVDEIKSDVGQFLALRKIDSDNEKFPIQAFQTAQRR